MKILDVIRRPKQCPRCGGDVCDIIYGEPTSTWQEDYLKETGHKAVLGGCCIPLDKNAPTYQCEDCGQQFQKFYLARIYKKVAYGILVHEAGPNIFSDVEFLGIYKHRFVFQPVVKEGVHWDGIVLIFVNQIAQVEVKCGPDNLPIIDAINREKQIFQKRTESFYRQAALREIKGDEYYKSVRKVGMLNGQRIYQPVFKDEYIKEPLCIGLPMVIMVSPKGKAISMRSLEAIEIIQEAGKRKKK